MTDQPPVPPAQQRPSRYLGRLILGHVCDPPRVVDVPYDAFPESAVYACTCGQTYGVASYGATGGEQVTTVTWVLAPGQTVMFTEEVA